MCEVILNVEFLLCKIECGLYTFQEYFSPLTQTHTKLLKQELSSVQF